MPIKIEELCRYFRVGGSTVRALDGVSLNIDDGEYVTICGASGSGKSTLMNILGCLDVPTSGRYLLDGENVTSLADDKLSHIRGSKIGFVFQSFNLIQMCIRDRASAYVPRNPAQTAPRSSPGSSRTGRAS